MKNFYGDLPHSINKWIKKYENSKLKTIGLMVSAAPDFQHNKQLAILSKQQERYCFKINQSNLLTFAVYFAVRHCIEATWLNDRDQFLYPNKDWQYDNEFRNDCLAYTLFSNNIQSKFGTNHWIPFTEQEVNAREKFESNFMTDFISGKQKPPSKSGFTINMVFEPDVPYNKMPLQFSDEATAVFDTGRELWKYYHKQPKCNANASLYDIREFFQGRNETGKMNNKSLDETYMNLISKLRDKLNRLAEKIEPKVYEYEFLKQ
ncbi:MAG: nucleoside 5-triphosphatase RdgB (dHAPTP, dITP,XTP-specific) [Bacteroidia bacterium]|nr:nucleoside 5-triphosphatase RdgB (dHAPTP, dITP,XTP-specific) [Bacteroidia bacterium]